MKRTGEAMLRRSFVFGVLAGGIAVPAAAWSDDDGTVKLRELYNKDLSFSSYARDREGQRVSVSGYMAPPLKAESDFFVLTKRPMAVCPFCDTEADWPSDIVAIYTKRQVEVVSFHVPIIVRGTLELGTYKDPELGFVSRVRLVDAVYERA